jgi:predicted nucleic acid-binding protein
VTAAVLDASAAVELITRTEIGTQIAELIVAAPVLWVPDGLFDVEVQAVLRRWDLNGVLSHEDVVAARLRLGELRLRRARVTRFVERAWSLRSNITFPDACYVALAERLQCSLITSDWKLIDAPNLPVPTLHPKLRPGEVDR